MAIIIGIVVIIIIAIASMYNGLVKRKHQVDFAFAGIDVQLKKRYDLIPNLVEIVKKYMKFEEGVLDKLLAISQKPYEEMSEEEKVELNEEMGYLSDNIKKSIAEYPELESASNVRMLIRTLNETEEQLSASRRSFNAAVMAYNSSIETFPNNIIAGMGDFPKRIYFQAEKQERENVTVKL